MKKILSAAAIFILGVSSAHATLNDVVFTSSHLWSDTYGGVDSYTVASTDGSILATATGTYKGVDSKVSGLNVEGIGVLTSVPLAWSVGGVASERPIDNEETLTVTFSKTVDIQYVKFDRWEGADIARVTTDTGLDFNLQGDSNWLSGDEVKTLNLMGVNSISFTAVNGWTSFFLEGFGGVTASATSEVPVPAAAWLFGSALLGLAGIRKKS